MDAWVWDFGDLKRRTKAITDELDHKFLLQAESAVLDIADRGDAWEVGFKGRRYQFPKSDVVALPIDNSTAERLAEWIAERLRAEFVGAGATTIREITVGVEEMPGQAGWYTVNW